MKRTCIVNNTLLTAEPIDPVHACRMGRAFVYETWLQWQGPVSMHKASLRAERCQCHAPALMSRTALEGVGRIRQAMTTSCQEESRLLVALFIRICVLPRMAMRKMAQFIASRASALSAAVRPAAVGRPAAAAPFVTQRASLRTLAPFMGAPARPILPVFSQIRAMTEEASPVLVDVLREEVKYEKENYTQPQVRSLACSRAVCNFVVAFGISNRTFICNCTCATKQIEVSWAILSRCLEAMLFTTVPLC